MFQGGSGVGARACENILYSTTSPGYQLKANAGSDAGPIYVHPNDLSTYTCTSSSEDCSNCPMIQSFHALDKRAPFNRGGYFEVYAKEGGPFLEQTMIESVFQMADFRNQVNQQTVNIPDTLDFCYSD